MPTSIQIIHAQDFIRATPDGILDREASLKLLAGIESAASSMGQYHVLIDTRRTHSTMPASDLWYLAEGLARQRNAFHRKTAVLCPLGRMDYAEFLALCSRNRGLEVSAFTSFEEAIEWLIADWADA